MDNLNLKTKKDSEKDTPNSYYSNYNKKEKEEESSSKAFGIFQSRFQNLVITFNRIKHYLELVGDE